MTRKKRTWRYVYNAKNSKRRKCIRMILYIIGSPIVIPLWVLSHLGYWSEIAMDKLDDASELITEFIVFKVLGRK